MMSDGQGSEPLQALEAELQECLRQDNFFDALDIYEDIQASGQATAAHYYGMGTCLFKLRRRRYAKEAWMRAYEMNPGEEKVVEALNKNFPGWRKAPKKAARADPTPKIAPASPPPARPTAGPHGTRPVVSGASPRPAGPSPAPPSAARRPGAPAGAAPRASGSGPGGTIGESEINWDFVIQDVEEGLARAIKEGSPYVGVPRSERGAENEAEKKEEKPSASAENGGSAAAAGGAEEIDYEGSGGV